MGRLVTDDNYGDIKSDDDDAFGEEDKKSRTSHNTHHFISHSYLEFLINNKFFKLN